MPGSSDDEYGVVARGRLKLKLPDSGVESKSKKSKKKQKKKSRKSSKEKEAAAQQQQLMSKEAGAGAQPDVDTRTAAERAHARVVEARMAEQLLKRAEKSHKERIMDFNTKLENSSEHFDIPKLSWTK